MDASYSAVTISSSRPRETLKVSLWCFLMGLVMFLSARSLYRASTSKDWPTTGGTVTKAFLDVRSNSGRAITYTPIVRYQYTVDGKTYTSGRITYYSQSFVRSPLWALFTSVPRKAEEIISRYPEGQSVVVYYVPDDPASAVPSPGIMAGGWFQPGFLMFVMICLVALVIVRVIDEWRGLLEGKDSNPDKEAANG